MSLTAAGRHDGLVALGFSEVDWKDGGRQSCEVGVLPRRGLEKSVVVWRGSDGGSGYIAMES